MTERLHQELNISKPVAVWNREIKAEPRKLLVGIGKMLAEGVMQDWSDFSGAALDTLDAAGLRKQPEELAWLLISRSLLAAISRLTQTFADLFRDAPSEEKAADLGCRNSPPIHIFMLFFWIFDI